MSKLGFAPTEEQEACIEAFGTGENIVIIAGAGAAKTTTCQLMSEATDERGCYIAYNSSIAGEAKSKFPSNVVCKTSHGFAMAAVGKDYRHKITNGAPTPARELVRFLKINSPFKLPSDAMIAPWALARMSRDTVQRFCYSADRHITAYHIPFTPGAEEVREQLADLVVPWANHIWKDYENLRGTLVWGRSHDPYLKMAQLRGLKLPGKFFMLDEAQDTNPCVQDIFENQDGQLIAVGDANQQLYAWRGAQDYMSKMQAEHRLTLSKSFRFGPAVAEEANKWLELLNAELRIEGFDQVKSVVHPIELPDAVLCRTNAETIGQAMQFHELGKTVGIVGGTGEIKRLAEGAIALQSGQPASHPDMIAFKTWGEFKEYVEEEGSDHQTFVRIVDTYGATTVLQVADKCVDDRYADVVISTGHKAKGREWGKVKIGNDFQPPEDSDTGEEGVPSKPEMMLAYVAVTRAKNELDVGSLEWVNNYLKIQKNQPLTCHPEAI